MTRLLLAAIFATAGCGSGGALLGKPAHKVKPGLSVPYIVGDPVPNPPVRAAFARTPWLPVDAAGPTMAGQFIDRQDNHVLYDRLRREVWGLGRPKLAWEEIDPNALEALRIRPPTTHIWLIGPEGPCRATLGQPRVAAHETVGEVIEVRYDLEGCVPAAWAPVGSLVEQMPSDVRWRLAEEVAATELAPEQDWTHPFSKAAAWPDESVRRADAMTVVARAVRGLDPVPAQTIVTAVWHDADDSCLDREVTAVTHLLSGRAGVEPQTPLPDLEAVVPELLGAVVQDNSPQALVYDDRIDFYVAIPPAHPDERPDLPAEVDRGPERWTPVTVETGPHTDAEFDAAAYRILPACSR